MATLNTILVYCTRKNVAGILSQEGVDLRIDMNNDGYLDGDDLQTLDDGIIEGTEDVNFWCWPRYSPEKLVQSNWVNRQTTYLSCAAVCRLKGNPVPDSIQNMVDKILEWLEAIADSKRDIPGIAERRGSPGIVDNIRFDARYNFRCLRVEQNCSSQEPTSRPVVPDYREAMNWER